MTQTHTDHTLRLPEGHEDDLDKLRDMVALFREGRITATQLKVFRVPQGVYEQREPGTFMLRIRLPGGVLLPDQMRALSRASAARGNGVLHVTSRQDVQVHRVALESIHPALVSLAEAGLSARGGGGNTVRNVVACPHAGVCPREAFDVTGHAVAMTEFMLADPASFQLPRKYKIAFSGCPADCAGATVNDVGMIATRRDGADGFAVHVGGGMGARSRVAQLLAEFVPAAEAPLVAEAVKRVFHRYGNRKNRHHARLRFLIGDLGFDEFRRLYERELARLRAEPPDVPAPRAMPHVEAAPAAAPEEARRAPDAFDPWRRANVSPQKQPGFHLVRIPLPLGDISAADIDALADVVSAHGEGMLRTTQDQDFILRWVTEGELVALYEALDEIHLAEPRPAVLSNMVACAGASTCRLGICLSRGLATAAAKALTDSGTDLAGLGDLSIHISGCPNSCGRHPIGQIGLYGGARRVAGRLAPHYTVQLGGRLGAGRTKLAEGRRAIPARNVPAFLAELLAAFRASAHCPDFHAFLADGGTAAVDALLDKHQHAPAFEEDESYYFDWGAERIFSLAGRGPGECSASMLDLIEADLNSAEDALGKGDGYRAAALAARALLVTFGKQPGNDMEAFGLFRQHFVEAGLVSDDVAAVADAGLACASGPNGEAAFAEGADAAAMLAAVKELFRNMDSSLRFPTPAKCEAAGDPSADVEKDFRGVACPLNYVKAKLALEQMAAGQTLSILLDEQGARNVPDSAAADGHEVVAKQQEGDHWRVTLRKGAR